MWSSGDLGNMAISISKLSLAPFSKINICPESSLCVDTGITLVPKDTIKNCASTLLRFTERVASHLFVTWRPSYSKMYLVRFSVVHQSNSFAMILCSLGVFMPCWKSMKLALLCRLDALVQKLILGIQKKLLSWVGCILYLAWFLAMYFSVFF